MSTTTTNYGLIKPDTTDPILVGQLNDNADVIDATLKSLSDALDVAKLGIKYKGEVNYYSNLPSSGNQIGDAYTVKYAGSSGTTPDGTEYVWGTVSGTNQWINFSKDSYTKAEVDALLALKQNALTTTQLDAVNSGIDSTKVEQIENNKNNISSAQQSISTISPRTIAYTYKSTAADTYELIPQLTVTLPHDKTICISAAASRNGVNAITGIQIQQSDTQSDENIIGIAEATATYRCLTATGMYKNTSNANTTINIYAKCDEGNILHNCYVFYWYI